MYAVKLSRAPTHVKFTHARLLTCTHVREHHRQRERERQTERETDRETDRETERERFAVTRDGGHSCLVNYSNVLH